MSSLRGNLTPGEGRCAELGVERPSSHANSVQRNRRLACLFPAVSASRSRACCVSDDCSGCWYASMLSCCGHPSHLRIGDMKPATPGSTSPRGSAPRRRPVARWLAALGTALLTVSVLRAAEPRRAAPHAIPERATPVRPGEPYPSASAADLERFRRGRAAFETSHGVQTGLGPVFNDSACNRCHNRKGVGGAGIQSVTLVGRLEGDRYDPLLSLGGPGLASTSVLSEPAAEVQRLIPNCKLSRDGEPVPSAANVVARRRTTALFGLGLVDATPDASFLALANAQPAPIRGRAARVQKLATGGVSVGKFGWKAQAPSLQQFSGMALLLELGVTNPEFGTEQPPLGDAASLAACDPVPELEEDALGV